MKCKFCGAELKEKSKVCAQCGSAVERPELPVTVKAYRKPPKDIIRVTGKIVIALVCVSAAAIVVATIHPFRESTLRFTHESSTDTSSAPDLPRNKTDLTGLIISCDPDGTASVEYEGSTYEKVRILDEELIEWLNDTDRSLESVEIRFATDENGNIRELGLFSADFFVIDAEENRYTAVRDGQVILFTARMSLEISCCYEGYFSYPDMRLYWGRQRALTAIDYVDPKCDDKKVETRTEYYTGEEVNVYQISAVGSWYYCSQEIYDSIQVDDLLYDYELYSDQNMDFISVR